MAEESEKRFHAVMDKLFFAPPPNSKSTKTPHSTRRSDAYLERYESYDHVIYRKYRCATAGGFFRGKKRSHAMSTPLAVMDSKSIGGTLEVLRNTTGGTVQSPMCRPWDREDLLKRLATFKSMTWFAKPEVVSAINCARRGWVNVDMDIIACESCGARLFFSTPSSWAQQQVENAASVFSLKLNNGHKLLCPWVDNACDEKLAQFPPTSTPDLVENYKKRSSSLLQLLELPVISSSAVNYVNTPLLEHFLKNPQTQDNVYEYYQAQKLISLCGWEPKLLPYIVDCKNVKDQSITVYRSQSDENVEANNEKYDHTSVVLDCRVCGARVGLWAFSTTPRPVEFFRLIGHADVNDENAPTLNQESIAKNGGGGGRNLLNLTIAGGPPPAEQNFRPTISLPVVGQNLRTRFSSAFHPVDGEDGGAMSADQPENINPVAGSFTGGKSMEFDPIKQHRHFCPWIVSSGKSAPGWKQTLSALERQKEFVSPLMIEASSSSSSLIEVEDPVGSVKRLLTPPSAKRKKFTHGSS